MDLNLRAKMLKLQKRKIGEHLTADLAMTSLIQYEEQSNKKVDKLDNIQI